MTPLLGRAAIESPAGQAELAVARLPCNAGDHRLCGGDRIARGGAGGDVDPQHRVWIARSDDRRVGPPGGPPPRRSARSSLGDRRPRRTFPTNRRCAPRLALAAGGFSLATLLGVVERRRPMGCDLAAADAGVEGLPEPESNTPADHSVTPSRMPGTGEAIASGDQRRWAARACSTRSRRCRCRARRPPRPRGREHRIARMVSVPRLREGRRPGRSAAARAEARIGVVFVFAGGAAPLEGELHDDSISQPEVS